SQSEKKKNLEGSRDCVTCPPPRPSSYKRPFTFLEERKQRNVEIEKKLVLSTSVREVSQLFLMHDQKAREPWRVPRGKSRRTNRSPTPVKDFQHNVKEVGSCVCRANRHA
ncbi:unnamed protein product, partial [Ectocarpus sp. 8 AP-2014]